MWIFWVVIEFFTIEISGQTRYMNYPVKYYVNITWDDNYVEYYIKFDTKWQMIWKNVKCYVKKDDMKKDNIL